MSSLRSETVEGLTAQVGRLRASALGRRRRLLAVALALAGVAAVVGIVLHAGRTQPALHRAGAPSTVTVQQLLPLLTRSGAAPSGVEVDATYAPNLFFEVTGQPRPAAATARPSLVFFLQENIHEGLLPPAAPTAVLRVDTSSAVRPFASTTLSADEHHRLTRLLFPATAAAVRSIGDGGTHTLSVLLTARDGSVADAGRLTWRLPVPIPAARPAVKSEDAAARAAAAGPLDLSALTRTLYKSVSGVRYAGVDGVAVGAIYATEQYFKEALPAEAVQRYAPSRNVVFVITATSHTASLGDTLPALRLEVGGRSYRPDLQDRRIWSPHHQVALVRFPAPASVASKPGVMSLALPDGSVLHWALPLRAGQSGSLSPFGIPWASILALLGGFLGAMWPCLFQLTVFFMPTLAGVGAEHAATGNSRLARRQIARAAFFFVLGFMIVYTAAGAIIGFAAEKLHSTSSFETYQRYFGIAAGLVILVLAIRVAIRGRAPLVCKMPIAPRMKRRAGATPVEMMLAGLAFATGCMTCFGSAIVIGMVVYVGLSNSALYGAFILFLFSLGMGIPLGIAAMAMGRVMPLLNRMEKAMPWMALTSAAIMVGYGALLISGNYMALSAWIYRITG